MSSEAFEGNLTSTMSRSMREKLRMYFESSLEKTGHQSAVEKCKTLYKKCSDPIVFLKEFTTCLRYAFVYSEKHQVEELLNFASKLTISIYISEKDVDDSSNDDEEMGYFLSSILNFLFNSHGASWPYARLRVLQLINKILIGLPENFLISEVTWKKLSEIVLIRLTDRNALVRVQAVQTAKKLQEPRNPNCEIIKAFIYHLNDPIPAVRRAVVSSLALNKQNIGYIMAKTRDINDNVRRHAYLVFAKVKITSLTIKYRLILLERGLKDRSPMVLSFVKNVLLKNWIENCNGDIVQLLCHLDVINSPEVAVLVLEAVFESLSCEDIVRFLPLDDTHTIPNDKLTPENSLVWSCLAQKLLKTDNDEELETIIPDLSIFCTYIRGFYPLDLIENSSWESQSEEEKWADLQRKHILKHLLTLLKAFDLRDEMGRNNLKKLILDMLTSTNVYNKVIECLIELLHQVIPDENKLLEEIAEVISEIRQPMNQVAIELSAQDKIERERELAILKIDLNELKEDEYNAVQQKEFLKAQDLKEKIEALQNKIEEFIAQPTAMTQEVREEKNDPVTLSKCLLILVETLKLCPVKSITPCLRSLLDNFVEHCFEVSDLETQSLAVHALSLYCLLDKDLAKEKLVFFLFMAVHNKENDISVPALKAIFDMIHKFGTGTFETLDETRVEEHQSRSRTLFDEDDMEFLNETVKEDEHMTSNNSANCLRVLKNLLDSTNENDEIRKTAYEGFCKLLASGAVHSSNLLSRIITMGFSPVKDDETEDFIRQVFIVFFPIFAAKTPCSQLMIQKAFIPTMLAVIDAPLGSINADISPNDVAAFLIGHTKPKFNEFTLPEIHVHNDLAITICHELLKDPVKLVETKFVNVYLKALNLLNLNLEKPDFKLQISNFIEQLLQEFTDKRTVQFLKDFRNKINIVDVKSVENTLASTDNEATTSATFRSSVVTDNEATTSATFRSSGATAGNLTERRTIGSRLTLVSETIPEEDEPKTETRNQILVTKTPRVSRRIQNINKENFIIPESPDISEMTSEEDGMTQTVIPESPELSETTLENCRISEKKFVTPNISKKYLRENRGSPAVIPESPEMSDSSDKSLTPQSDTDSGRFTRSKRLRMKREVNK